MKSLQWLVVGLLVLIVGVILSIRWGVFHSIPPPKTTNNKLQIYTSFYPLYFFTSEIAKDKGDVVNVTPSGAEPHDYEPTAREIARITTADVLVLNGVGLETWITKIKKQFEENDVFVIVAGKDLGTSDPHIWLDPIIAKKIVERIASGLANKDPGNAQYYKSNANILLDKLDSLDAEFKRGLINCEQNSFVTSHAAFGYLAIRYGIQQVAISGISPEEEPSLKTLSEIADMIKKNNILVIFFETLVSPKLSQTIATETGATTLVLDPLEGISPKDMQDGKNYFTIMRENLKNLQTALQCNT